jgi:hypothetical protein
LKHNNMRSIFKALVEMSTPVKEKFLIRLMV